jgi:4-aminobutyrate aminotransferase / (S)-3-amino-2-methylpropionate transaminase / 5-aminovalerate transaminase
MSTYKFFRSPQETPFIDTEYRKIHTPIPAPGTKAILSDLEACESRSMQGQLPLVWDRATNFSIYDKAGNQWIDFTSAIFVANIGHANPRLISAVKRLLDRNLIHTYTYPHEIRSEYLKKLVAFAGPDFEKGFLVSSGTEATEAALKLMRLNGTKQGKKRNGVICLDGNWHGRTMGAQFMSSSLEQKEWIGNDDPNIHHIPFPYPWVLGEKSPEAFLQEGLKHLERKQIDLAEDVCGFMLETFQGWGAVFYPEEFVQAIEKICREKNILLVFDEMQAGFARTGKKFGYEHYGVKADMIVCGKGMSSGFPLSGIIGSSEVMDIPAIGSMSSTHSANPIVCTAGLATLDEIESNKLVEESERKGVLLHDKLNALKKKYSDRITYVLGRGLIAAVLFCKPGGTEPDAEFTSQVAELCMRKGLLVVHTGRESVKIGPPLTISDDALLEGIEVLDEAIAEIIGV